MSLAAGGLATWTFVAASLVAATARAQDPFEIQVYDPELNEVGHAGLELHSNVIAAAAKEPGGDGSELPRAHVLHETLEASYGVARRVELGAYLQLAARPEGRLDFAGVKLRLKLQAPLAAELPFGAGLNIEVSYVPATYDATIFGAELRPILEWRYRELTVDVNPIVDLALRGPDALVPVFAPAAAVRLTVSDAVMIGVEYYSEWGPITHLPRIAEQAHYLFHTVNVVAFRRWELHAGVGVGLTPASDGVVVKSIVGHEL